MYKTYQNLLELSFKIVNSFKTYCNSQENKLSGLLKISDKQEVESQNLFFDVGNYHFRLTWSIKHTMGYVYLQTFLIEENLEILGKLKAEHISDLDIILFDSGQLKFAFPQKEQSQMMGFDNSNITDYDLQYTVAIIEYLKMKEYQLIEIIAPSLIR